MSNLGPQQQNASFAGLLQVPGGITSTLQTVQDGNGNPTALSISTTAVSGLSIVAGSANNLYGGDAGELPYQSATGATSFLGAGSAFQLLQSNGSSAPSWTSTPRGNSFRFNGSSSGQVTLSGGIAPANQIYSLPTTYPSASGQALTSTTGGAMSWATVPTTSGQSILAGNNSGGFQNVNLSGLSYDSGTSTLSVTGGGSNALVFNVKDYGAIGDNDHDDTAAIQATITAAGEAIGGWSGGGIVYFPTGNYKITSVLTAYNNAIVFTGEGSGSSVIFQWTLSESVISFSTTNAAQSSGVNKIGIRYNGTPTGGFAILINACNNIRLTNFDIFSAYTGILIQNSSAIFVETFNITDYVNIGIYCVGPVNDVYVNNFIMNTGLGGALGGIRLYNKVEAFTCSNGDILEGAWSMTTAADSYSPGTRPAYNVFSNVYFDASENGVLIANCVEFDFVGCWFSGGRIDGVPGRTAKPGLTLSTSDSIRFTNTKFFNNGAEGAIIGPSAVRTNFTSCTFQSNSRSSSGTYSGMRFVAGANDFQVLGCMGNNLVYGGLQNYALTIDAGCNNFIVANNNFRGTGGGISNAAGTSATQIVSSNLG